MHCIHPGLMDIVLSCQLQLFQVIQGYDRGTDGQSVLTALKFGLH